MARPSYLDAGARPNLTFEDRQRGLERDPLDQESRAEVPPRVMDRLVDGVSRDAEVGGDQIQRLLVEDVGQEDPALVSGQLLLDQASDQSPRLALLRLQLRVRSLVLERPLGRRAARVHGGSPLPAPAA